MARINISSFLSVAILLPTTLGRPFHFHAGGWFPVKYLPHYHSPPDYNPTPTQYSSSSSIFAPTTTVSHPSFPTGYPHPTGTGKAISASYSPSNSSSYIYPSSYTTFAPTGTNTIIPTGTSIGTTVGTATGTLIPYPSPYLNNHEAEALAKEKRHIFEGPRRRDFPHYWPPYHHHSDTPPDYGSSTGTAGPTGTGGTGCTTATGVGTGGVSSGWMATGTGGVLPTGYEGGLPTGYGYYGH